LITSGWNAWEGFAPTILQYTSKGTLPGITGPCDVNQVKLSLADFLKLATRTTVVPQKVGEDDMAKLVKVTGDKTGAIYLAYVSEAGRTVEHIHSGDELPALEAVYGTVVSVPSLKGLGTIVEGPDYSKEAK
jgi:hypothetical protein